MLVRSAFWIGAPRVGQAAVLADAINTKLIPAMRRFPGVQAVHALWPQRLEDQPPNIYCQVVVRFDSIGDMQTMLQSDERAALRPQVKAAMELFEGHVSHIDYQAR
jgi:antibiotic biosynthesis monooxygenase (ABM) superfamily enzyme